MRNAKSLLLALAVVLSAAGQSVAGPLGTLYLTDGDAHRMFIIQGNSMTTVATGSGGAEYAIAVQSTVRISSAYDNIGFNQGREYNLNGTPTGTTYTNSFGDQLLDGTTDGSFNYATQWNTNRVIRFDTNWANPTVLFTVPGGNDEIGLTYDSLAGTLWSLSRSSGIIRQLSLTGTLISSFSIGAGRAAPLAFDATDGTLWTFVRGPNTIEQWSRTGTLLSSQSYAGLSGNILGGEFALSAAPPAVPEPASLALMSLGGIGMLGGWYRRRRATLA